MAFTITGKLLNATQHVDFSHFRGVTDEDRLITISMSACSVDALEELAKVCDDNKNDKQARVVRSVIAAMRGDFNTPVPSIAAFASVVEEYIKANSKNSWLYRRDDSGFLYPVLVTAIKPSTIRRGETPTVIICTAWYGYDRYSERGKPVAIKTGSIVFEPNQVARKTVAKALASEGYLHETKELRDEYDQQMSNHRSVVENGFGCQFRAIGTAIRNETSPYDGSLLVSGHKLIHDLAVDDFGPYNPQCETELVDGGYSELPQHPVYRYFDLSQHEHIWIHSGNVERYQYDKTIGDKLILPESHRHLLNVLTTDISAFSSDIIEGKSAGNIIMCVGAPGLGKTLTAEIYAEICERPLYNVHAGSLGSTAEDVDKNLRKIISRARRWNCVVLLDEADVFVQQRRDNLVQNAIVAEFLRVLEYTDICLFMCSNRPDDVDEAIIPRCAAIIRYELPSRTDAAKIWRIMADNFGFEISDKLLENLLESFPTMPPRDIKMVSRLALRMARSKGDSQAVPDLELFRQCALFRGLKLATIAETDR